MNPDYVTQTTTTVNVVSGSSDKGRSPIFCICKKRILALNLATTIRDVKQVSVTARPGVAIS